MKIATIKVRRIDLIDKYMLSLYDHPIQKFMTPKYLDEFPAPKRLTVDYISELTKEHFGIDYRTIHENIAITCKLKNNCYVVTLEVPNE